MHQVIIFWLPILPKLTHFNQQVETKKGEEAYIFIILYVLLIYSDSEIMQISIVWSVKFKTKGTRVKLDSEHVYN